MARAREAISQLVNAPRGAQDIVLIENASGGINGILRSFGLEKGMRLERCIDRIADNVVLIFK